MTALQRLLKYPHSAVFDTDPDGELALRVRNPAGLVWEVAGTELRLITGQNLYWDGEFAFDGVYDWGLTRREYSLLGKTVGQLADELIADGHQVLFESDDFRSLAAHVLVTGSGDQSESNGDHIQGYTSLLWVYYAAQAIELEQAGVQVEQALRQMVMTQAEDEWLDVWATLYGVLRGDAETDGQLQLRIPREVFRERVNRLAIEQAVLEQTGYRITLHEPWRELFTLSESRLSDTDRLQDGQYYTYHVIHPVGDHGTDWDAVLPVIRRNKAAGIDLWSPMSTTGMAGHIAIQPPVEYRVETAQTDVHGSGVLSSDDWALGILRLDYSEPIINHVGARHELWVTWVSEGLQTQQDLGAPRSVAMASVCLSDGAELGDENCILSRGSVRVDFDPVPSASDELALSSYSRDVVVELVEFATIRTDAADAESPFTAVADDIREDIYASGSEDAHPYRTWIGVSPLRLDGSWRLDGSQILTGTRRSTQHWDHQSWRSDWRIAGSTMTEESI